LGQRVAECPAHGKYASTGRKMLRREIWSACPACEADRMAAEQRERDAEKAAWAERQRVEALQQTAIPDRFHERTFDGYVADTDAKRYALTVARGYAEAWRENAKTGAGLIFAGMPGTGKSHLAACVLKAVMADGGVARYVTCMDMIRAVRDTWRRDSERSERELLRVLGTEVSLLAIDEVGAQYGTDGEAQILFDVLDRRYREMRPTILLTNQDKRGFAAVVGERVMDRLRETSRWVPFDWASYRAEARKAAA
jgi:DNA replication protein DnaC